MRHVELKSYCFDRRPQWATAVCDLLEVGDESVTAAARMTVERLPGAGTHDRTSALAFDPCNEPQWIRDATFEWIRGLPSGRIVAGRLDGGELPGAWQPVALAVGLRHLWVLVERRKGDPAARRVLRYVRRNLQRLGALQLERPVLALCGDGGEGAWLALGGDGKNAELVHLDTSGARQTTVMLPVPVDKARIGLTSTARADCDDGAEVVLLDMQPCVACPDPPLAWRLWCVKRSERPERPIFQLRARDEGCCRDVPDFHPDLMAADASRRVHVVAGSTGEAWTLRTTGELLARRSAIAPAGWRPLTAIAARERVAVGGTCGVGELRAIDASEAPAPDGIPTVITPPMVSPEGVERGWMRADLDIHIEQGAAVEISVAEVSDALERDLRRLLDDTTMLPATRIRRIESLLPWTRTELYRGGDMPEGRPLRYPLHEIEATRLCLRIRIHAALDTAAPSIRSLHVLYPNLSYSWYLPAVYQVDPASAATLRRLLAILESVFGDLETELHELPRRIDPRTAPDAWLPFLLSWLGLPAPTEIDARVQRVLLKRAPELLRHRGTRAALEGLLRILVGNDFLVVDLGEGPAPWALPPEDRPARGPRLGCDTLVLVAQQPGFRLAYDARLGERTLGYSVLDPTSLFARRSGAVEIRVALDEARRARVEPVLRRYLLHFIPAHCRYRLRFVSRRELGRPVFLTDDLRVEAEEPSRLGADARVGRLRLHEESSEGIVLGRSTLTDGLFLS